MQTSGNMQSGLTGNQLKILALIAMTCDHVGLQLLPGITILRIIGRLAFPIFAFMIAEGCRYTRNRRKYLLTMAALAFVCQLVYYFAMGSLYMCVLVTFSLSVGLIYVLEWGKKRGGISWGIALGAMAAAVFFSEILPWLLSGTDYAIDYGIWGIALPIFVYFGRSREDQLKLTSAALIMLSMFQGGIQWFSLAALLPLSMYNGTRGRRKLKNLFYIYYPVHLVVIYGLSLII